MTSTAPALTASDRNLIADAKRICDAMSTQARRDYLAAHNSVYAANPDPIMIDAAFLGHALSVLDHLAHRLEHELTRVPGPGQYTEDRLEALDA